MTHLHVVAKKGAINSIQTITNPQDLFALNHEGITPLYVAAENLNYDWIRALIKANLLTVDLILFPNKDNETFLHNIFTSKEEDIIDHCLKECIKQFPNDDHYLHMENMRGETPWGLQSLIALGSLAKLDSLEIKREIDNPLNLLIIKAGYPHQRDAILGILKRLSKNINALTSELLLKISPKGMTPLEHAAGYVDLEILKILLPVLEINYPYTFTHPANMRDAWLHELLKQPDAYSLINELGPLVLINNITSWDENGDTALHAAMRYDHAIDSVPLLIQLSSPNFLEYRNKQKEYPLFIAISERQFTIIAKLAANRQLTSDVLNLENVANRTVVELLLQKLEVGVVEKLMPILDENDAKITPIQAMYKMLHYSDQSYLQNWIDQINRKAATEDFKLSVEKIDKFFAIYNIWMVFGGQKIIDAVGHLPEIFEGGCIKEQMPFVKNMLKMFSSEQTDPVVVAKHQRLINFLESFVMIEEVNIDHIERVLRGDSLYTWTGYKKHGSGVLLERQDKQIVMSLFERELKHYEINVTSAVTSIKFNADDDLLKQVIDLLKSAAKSDLEVAKEMLFVKIPCVTGVNYADSNSKGFNINKKTFKVGFCFWANGIRAVMHNWFIQECNNIQEGTKDYKAFDLYMRKKTLEYYLQITPPNEQNQALIDVCKKIIEEKEEDFSNRYNISSNNNDNNNVGLRKYK